MGSVVTDSCFTFNQQLTAHVAVSLSRSVNALCVCGFTRGGQKCVFDTKALRLPDGAILT